MALPRLNIVNPLTLEEAEQLLKEENARAIAGGTDLLHGYKDNIYPDYASTLVNLKTIKGCDYIEEKADGLHIGALTTLHELEASEVLWTKYTCIAEAAYQTASPQIRNQATIAGNICQEPRCWYYRNADNGFNCLRKGGKICSAMTGHNEMHSIFGAGKVSDEDNPDRSCGNCIAVCPSDLAPALLTLEAEIVTNHRVIPAKEFWRTGVCSSTILEKDELVKEIFIPVLPEGVKSVYMKFRQRKAIDFPLVSTAVAIATEQNKVSHIRIAMGAVATVPLRAEAAENFMLGREINEESAAEAGRISTEGTTALKYNRYKIRVLKAYVRRAILKCK